MVYWINNPHGVKLGVMSRPRGGDWLEGEILGLKSTGVGIVVSLLQDDEVAEFELDLEAGLCLENGIQYVSFPIPDRDAAAIYTKDR